MIEFINSQDLLNTEQFVREPVGSLCKKINDDSSKRIILNGGRGSGKTTVLYSMQNRGIGTDKPVVYMWFDSVVNFSILPNGRFNDDFFNHYYELKFSWKLLNYIKKYYVITYEKYFKDIELLLEEVSEDIQAYVRNVHYKDVSLSKYLQPMELSLKILERLRNCLEIDTFTLAIDRFDWINGRSSYSQQVLSQYFDMFDKTIITSDDEMLSDINRFEELKKKGYSIIKVDYGYDVDVVKYIIRRRIQLYNRSVVNPKYAFDIDIVTDEIYKNLIDKTNGNISLILDIVNEVTDMTWWIEGIDKASEKFDRAAINQVNRIKQLKRCSTSPRLYL